MITRRRLADRVLAVLAGAVVLVVVALVASSVLVRVIDTDGSTVASFQRATALALLALSLALAVAYRILAEHPLYEYWAVVLVGALVGVVYLS